MIFAHPNQSEYKMTYLPSVLARPFYQRRFIFVLEGSFSSTDIYTTGLQ